MLIVGNFVVYENVSFSDRINSHAPQLFLLCPLRSFFQPTGILDIKEVERKGRRQALSDRFQQSDLLPFLSKDSLSSAFPHPPVLIFEMFRLMYSPEKRRKKINYKFFQNTQNRKSKTCLQNYGFKMLNINMLSICSKFAWGEQGAQISIFRCL